MKEWAESTSFASLAPSPRTAELDGVHCRMWVGLTRGGTPIRVAVHRVLMDAEYEAVLTGEFPILVTCEAPKSVRFTGAAAGSDVPSPYRYPCLKRLREALLTANRELCRHVAHTDEMADSVQASLAAIEIACDEVGGLPPFGVDVSPDGWLTEEQLMGPACPCRECAPCSS